MKTKHTFRDEVIKANEYVQYVMKNPIAEDWEVYKAVIMLKDIWEISQKMKLDEENFNDIVGEHMDLSQLKELIDKLLVRIMEH